MLVIEVASSPVTASYTAVLVRQRKKAFQLFGEISTATAGFAPRGWKIFWQAAARSVKLWRSVNP